MPEALVVEPALADARLITSALNDFRVTIVNDFVQARAMLRRHAFALLFTELRLREYNGLHLLLSAAEPGRAAPPIACVTSLRFDPCLRAEIERTGATFVPKPLERREVSAAILRTIARQRGPDASGSVIRPPFERRGIEPRRAVNLRLDYDRRHGTRRVQTLTSYAAAWHTRSNE